LPTAKVPSKPQGISAVVITHNWKLQNKHRLISLSFLLVDVYLSCTRYD